jgi:hypothetical protein
MQPQDIPWQLLLVRVAWLRSTLPRELASYLAPLQGFYVVAIEVREYRAGVQIGTMRRDLQIIVIPCPTNTAPAFGGVQRPIRFLKELTCASQSLTTM